MAAAAAPTIPDDILQELKQSWMGYVSAHSIRQSDAKALALLGESRSDDSTAAHGSWSRDIYERARLQACAQLKVAPSSSAACSNCATAGQSSSYPLSSSADTSSSSSASSSVSPSASATCVAPVTTISACLHFLRTKRFTRDAASLRIALGPYARRENECQQHYDIRTRTECILRRYNIASFKYYDNYPSHGSSAMACDFLLDDMNYLAGEHFVKGSVEQEAASAGESAAKAVLLAALEKHHDDKHAAEQKAKEDAEAAAASAAEAVAALKAAEEAAAAKAVADAQAAEEALAAAAQAAKEARAAARAKKIAALPPPRTSGRKRQAPHHSDDDATAATSAKAGDSSTVSSPPDPITHVSADPALSSITGPVTHFASDPAQSSITSVTPAASSLPLAKPVKEAKPEAAAAAATAPTTAVAAAAPVPEVGAAVAAAATTAATAAAAEMPAPSISEKAQKRAKAAAAFEDQADNYARQQAAAKAAEEAAAVNREVLAAVDAEARAAGAAARASVLSAKKKGGDKPQRPPTPANAEKTLEEGRAVAIYTFFGHLLGRLQSGPLLEDGCERVAVGGSLVGSRLRCLPSAVARYFDDVSAMLEAVLTSQRITSVPVANAVLEGALSFGLQLIQKGTNVVRLWYGAGSYTVAKDEHWPSAAPRIDVALRTMLMECFALLGSGRRKSSGVSKKVGIPLAKFIADRKFEETGESFRVVWTFVSPPPRPRREVFEPPAEWPRNSEQFQHAYNSFALGSKEHVRYFEEDPPRPGYDDDAVSTWEQLKSDLAHIGWGYIGHGDYGDTGGLSMDDF